MPLAAEVYKPQFFSIKSNLPLMKGIDDFVYLQTHAH